MLDNAKLGIVAGSLTAGLLGYMLLRITLPKSANAIEPGTTSATHNEQRQ